MAMSDKKAYIEHKRTSRYHMQMQQKQFEEKLKKHFFGKQRVRSCDAESRISLAGLRRVLADIATVAADACLQI